MDGLFDTSLQKEEEIMVSALHHVISGRGEDNFYTPMSAQIEHNPMLPPQIPPVFSTGESSSSTKLKKKKNKKSGKIYRGVRKRGNRWVAEIWDPHQGKVQWLSSFAKAEEAARAYDRKAIEYRGVDGAFPYTNFQLEDYLYPNPSISGTNNNAPIATTHVVPTMGPRVDLTPSTSATTNDSAPHTQSSTGTGGLPNNINTVAEEDDPLLLLDDFDDDTLQQFMALAASL